MNHRITAMIGAIILATFGLAGCDNVSKADAERMASDAASTAAANATAKTKAEEAAKKDGELSAAKAEMKKLATDTARQGSYSATANCNVLPAGFAATSAAKNFPSNAPAEYRAACAQEVATMNSDRQRTIAKAKADEAKRLAKKADDAKTAKAPKRPNAVKSTANTTPAAKVAKKS